MNRWTLTTAEISYLLKDFRIEPGSGSPFQGLRPPQEGFTSASFENEKELMNAFVALLQPEAIHGLVSYTPDEQPSYSWFYGDSIGSSFAFHSEKDTHQIAWPVDILSILEILELPLNLLNTNEIDEISFILDRRGLETMAAIIDLIQEQSLTSLLERSLSPEIRFDEKDLLDCLNHNIKSTDFRWMIPRTMIFSPIRLKYTSEDIIQGMEWLHAKGLLTLREGRYALSPPFGIVCSLLGSCSGLSALSSRRQQIINKDNKDWSLQHLAALKGIDNSLWLFEYTDITSDDFHVEIQNTTGRSLNERLQSEFFPSGKPAAPPPSIPSIPPQPELKSINEPFCPNCGTQLKPKASFCTKCGARVEQTHRDKQQASTTPPPTLQSSPRPTTNCSNCGAEISSNSKFCTKCGTSLGQTKTRSHPPIVPDVVICSKCGVKLSPNVKFCTRCGSPIKR